MGVFLIFIMLFSTVGFAFLNNPNDSEQNYIDNIEYKGMEFNSDGYFWYFEVDDVPFVTLYNLQELVDDEVSFSSANTLSNYHNQPLYYFGSDEGASEIDRNLRSRFVLRTGEACIDGEKCEDDLPIKDCTDNLIVFKTVSDGTDERMYQEDKCVFIVARKANIAKYADAFLFDILDL